MSVHIVPKNVYYLVFAVLLILTLVTVWVSFINLGRWNVLVALTIAIGKASLVVLYFMHVRYSPRFIGIVIAGGLLWLIILIVFTISDYLSRGWLA